MARSQYDNIFISGHARVQLGDQYLLEKANPESLVKDSETDPFKSINLPPGPDKYNFCMRSLYFAESSIRLATIKSRWGMTCQWFVQNPHFKQWLSPYSEATSPSALLWIKGKPGTGKSTTMKFLLGHLEQAEPMATIVSFFFNARGAELEKTAKGMYQSVVYQLLKSFPIFRDVFDAEEVSTLLSVSRKQITWTIEALQTLLKNIMARVQDASIIWLIDALDECNDDEDEAREVVEFLSDLVDEAQKPRLSFRVFFSSRHYPHISANSVDIVLEDQIGHAEDISSYVRAKLRVRNSSHKSLIAAEIIRRSRGIFLWVVLVVASLNREHDKGHIHMWKTLLKQLPDTLDSLFGAITNKEGLSLDAMRTCFRWLLFLPGRATPQELYYALRTRDDPAFQAEDEIIVDEDTLDLYIRDCSRGLADLTHTKPCYVEFIHETVREFLLKEMPKWTEKPINLKESESSETCFNAFRIKKLREYIPMVFDTSRRVQHRLSIACQQTTIHILKELDTISSVDDFRVQSMARDMEYDYDRDLHEQQAQRTEPNIRPPSPEPGPRRRSLAFWEPGD